MNHKKRTSKIFTKVLFIAYIGVLTAPMSTGWGAPEPALVPLTGDWQLDIELHGDPKLLQIVPPGETKTKNYWYLLYTVTNNTGQDVDFLPQIELFTDTFKLHMAGSKVRNSVFQAIRNRYRHTIPLMEPQDRVSEKLLQDQDNSRDSVAIFEDFDLDATQVRIFLSGGSNEVATVEHPILRDKTTQKPNKFLLRKTLMLEYQVSGDRYRPEKRVMLYKDRSWIMR
jgi:hypothetical protein